MKNENPDELQRWMATWTSESDHLSWAREDFARQRIGRYIKDLSGLLVFALGTAVTLYYLLAYHIFASFLPSLILVMIFAIYAVMSIHNVVKRIRAQREALPLSLPQYLASMRHNLAMRRGELTSEQRSLPIIVGVALLWAAWLTFTLWEGLLAEPYRLVVVGLVVGLVLPYALFDTFKRKPRHLRQEEEKLDELERQLRDDESAH